MKLLKRIHKKENGQVLIIVLILLLLGGLMIPPLLGFMNTGIRAGQVHDKKMDEVYAADAGVEDAIFNIITPDAPHYAGLQALAETESYTYPSGSLNVNGLPADVTITKLSLLQGLLGEDEYKLGQPHSDWIEFTVPEDEIVRDYDGDWVEYTCHVDITHDGGGNAKLDSVGAFFSRFNRDQSLVEGPYGYDGTERGVVNFDHLQAGSPERKFTSGGFAFIWRFEKNEIVLSTGTPTGGFDFKFKVYDAQWAYSVYFVWATVTRQDISFATNAPDLYKWKIEATAGDTDIRSVVFEQIDALDILTWEVNPPA